jgi:dihydroorotate dehydrogenase
MYKGIIRPILFLLNAEKVHHLVVFLVSLLTFIPFCKKTIRKWLTYNHPVLNTRIGNLEFKNKVGLAAGFDKNADFFEEFSLFGFSFIEIGTVTPVPQSGNPKPRLFRLKKDNALINRMGFNNKGVEHAWKQLKRKRKSPLIIGGNIGKNTATANETAALDYEKCVSALYDEVDYFAVNVSCPNIKDLGKLQDQDSLREILNRVMAVRKKKPEYKQVFLKISPDLTFAQIDEIIELYKETSLDGIIATNTTTERDCLLTGKETVMDIGMGGLSGAPLKNRSIEIIRYICKQSKNKIPVIGVGGIICAGDAVDMIKAGASLVQVYTGFIYDGPLIVRKINKAVAAYLLSTTPKLEND